MAEEDKEVIKNFNTHGFVEEIGHYLKKEKTTSNFRYLAYVYGHAMMTAVTGGLWVLGFLGFHIYKGYERFKASDQSFYTYVQVEEISEEEAEDALLDPEEIDAPDTGIDVEVENVEEKE